MSHWHIWKFYVLLCFVLVRTLQEGRIDKCCTEFCLHVIFFIIMIFHVFEMNPDKLFAWIFSDSFEEVLLFNLFLQQNSSESHWWKRFYSFLSYVTKIFVSIIFARFGVALFRQISGFPTALWLHLSRCNSFVTPIPRLTVLFLIIYNWSRTFSNNLNTVLVMIKIFSQRFV